MAVTDENNPIGLVTALAQEHSVVHPVAARSVGRLIAAQSGMGRAAGFLAAEKLGRDHKQLRGLVSIGFCGALDPALSTGNIVLPGAIVTSDNERFDTDAEWLEAISSALGGMPVITGRTLHCANMVVETRADKQAIFSSGGACVVDMESAGIAQAATRFNVPFIAIRIVLDEIADTLPEATRNAVKADGNLDMKGLLRGLAVHPGDLGGLLRLGAKSSRAQKQLKAVCEALSPGFGR